MSSPLAICMISDDFLPAATGVGVYLQLVGRELVRRGHRISVITSRRAGEAEMESWEGITIYRTFTLKVYGFYQALPSRAALRRILLRDKPDVIHHNYLGVMMMQVCVVAESLKLPQVATYHFSAEVITQPWPVRPFRGIIRKLVVYYNNRFDLVVAPSENLAQQMVAEGIRTPVRYITNPVAFGSTEEVVPAERSPSFTILYAGRLGPEKNLPYLLRALRELTRSIPDAVLWIAGRGPERDALDQLCDQLEIGDRVQFLGFLDHATLARYYAACDVFVLPSLMEAQPLVAMEAMWFCKPVIVTQAIVAAREMVDHGTNGFIVDPQSHADLAERLLQLATDSSLRTAMGAAGRIRALAYQPGPVVDALVDAYRDVVGRHSHA